MHLFSIELALCLFIICVYLRPSAVKVFSSVFLRVDSRPFAVDALVCGSLNELVPF